MIPRENFGDVDDLISILASRKLDTLRAYAQACEEDVDTFHPDDWSWSPHEITEMRRELQLLAEASAIALKIVLDDHDWISAENAALSVMRPQTETGQKKGYEDAMSV